MKPMSEKPTERGDYCYMCIHFASAMPMYASFDGENWLDSTFEDCYYIDEHVYPFGSENLRHAEPEVDNSLTGRLERYKASK